MKNNLLNKKKKGFTLIELIVVIAIIGILAAVAIPRFSGVQENAKQKAEQATLSAVQSAVRIYEAENGAIPTSTNINTFKSNYIGSDIKAPTSTLNSGKKISLAADGTVSYVATASVVTEIPYD